MKQLFALLSLLLFFTHSAAENVLYLSYAKPTERVIKGEYFPLTIKLLSTIGRYDEIKYSFSNAQSINILHTTPFRIKEGKYYYDTFYFSAYAQNAATPLITATLDTQEASLESLPVEVVVLNPKKNYAHILADTFQVSNYKTTVYDQENNIVVFSANATRSNLSKFKFSGIKKQGFESKKFDINASSITYYAVIPKREDNLVFTYFNLQKQKFENVVIPIIVDDDRVSTQSNLKPLESKHQKIKLIAAAVVLALALALLLYKRNIFFIIMVIAPAYYIYITALPTEYICIKEGSPIQLLPMNNGTIFETTQTQLTLQAQGNVGDFTKVQLKNEKIGWVNHENICTP
jgi:hypothetical protein